MTKKLVGLRTFAGVTAFALTIVWTVQAQQPMETEQPSIKQPVASDPLAEWEAAYSEAMNVAIELAESGSMMEARRLVDDLEDVDEALREFIHVTERLRVKKRALFDGMESLTIHNVLQGDSRQFQAIANALKVAHDVESNTIENMRK